MEAETAGGAATAETGGMAAATPARAEVTVAPRWGPAAAGADRRPGRGARRAYPWERASDGKAIGDGRSPARETKSPGDTGAFEEREKGFEPSTLALARRCSTTELFPHETTPACYQPPPPGVKHE